MSAGPFAISQDFPPSNLPFSARGRSVSRGRLSQRFVADTKDTTSKQDFRIGTCDTLKWNYFSKPLHMLNNPTNWIVCFDQPMNSNQSDSLF